MLLTVLIVSGAILGATAIAGLLMVYQMRQATNFGQSVQALFAADTGLEWSLYRRFEKSDYPKPVFKEITQSEFLIAEDSSRSIISIGCAGGTVLDARTDRCPRPVTRALQVIFK